MKRQAKLPDAALKQGESRLDSLGLYPFMGNHENSYNLYGVNRKSISHFRAMAYLTLISNGINSIDSPFFIRSINAM